MTKAKIAVLVPCFNVALTIDNFFNRITPDLIDNVTEFVLLNNASNDDTLEKMYALRAKHRAKISIFSNYKNYGYGGNIKIGFDYCLNRDFDYVAILHGDDQANSESLLTQFVKMANTSRPDLILASRFGKGSNLSGYNKFRVFGNIVFNVLTHIITGIRMSDAGSGIICAKTSLLTETPYRSLTNDFQFHPQLNLYFYSRTDLHIEEIPLVWADSLAPASIRLIHYALILFGQLIKYRLRKHLGTAPDRYFFDSLTVTDLQTRRIE